MLRLIGVDKPAQHEGRYNLGVAWTDLIDQKFDWVILRRMRDEPDERLRLLTTELKAGRPVGLLWSERDPETGAETEIGWVMLRMNEIRHYIFLDAVRKHPESFEAEGLFTERRVLRFDLIRPDSIKAVLYLETLIAPVPYRRRGRPRKVRP
jgi:hypothetical protein